MNENLSGTLQAFSELLVAMRQLRGVNGCEWNKAQTFFTLKAFLMEESYEVLDALPDAENAALPSPAGLCEELGDLLLQIVFLSTLAEEQQQFSMRDVILSIHDKIVRRHPHVFDEEFRKKTSSLDAQEVAKLWEEIKKREKALRRQPVAALSGVPRSMPALLRADTLGKKAHHNGFDWPHVSGVFLKLQEEVKEFEEAHQTFSQSPSPQSALALEGEMGDILFTMAQIARFLNFSAENALHGSCKKFISRFDEMEKMARQNGTSWEALKLDEKEALWNRAKEITDKPDA